MDHRPLSSIQLRCGMTLKTELDRLVSYFLLSSLAAEMAYVTDLSYDSIRRTNCVFIPVDVLNMDEARANDVVRDKVMKLKKFLEEDIDYSSMTTVRNNIMSTINYAKINPKLHITASYMKDGKDVTIDEPVNLKPWSLQAMTINDESILEIVNPYMSQGIVLIDMSVPYEDMGIAQNHLHIFEHICCQSVLRSKDIHNIVDSNGGTMSFGISFMYSILGDEENYKKTVNSVIEWMYKSRTDSFWIEREDDLKRELTRTSSETRYNNNYQAFARSPNSSFYSQANVQLLRYWANRPLKMTLIHPWKQLKVDLKPWDDKYPIEQIPRPSAPVYDWMPYESILMKPPVVTERVEPKEIARRLYEHAIMDRRITGCYGVNIVIKDVIPFNHNVLDDKLEYLPMFLISTFREYYSKRQLRELVMWIMLMFRPDQLVELNAVDMDPIEEPTNQEQA